MIRVVLADDHAIVRAGLKELLSGFTDIDVTGEATTGDDVLVHTRRGGFDVLVLDMSMPGRSGIELIKLVKAERPELSVLILSMHSEKQYAVRALRAGASAYLTKESAADDLVTAIRRVAGGGAYISQQTAEQLVFSVGHVHAGPPHSRLSDREYEVFRMIVAGRSVTEIGQALRLSVKTVSTHKARILQKMESASAADLVRYAVEHGLLDDSGSS